MFSSTLNVNQMEMIFVELKYVQIDFEVNNKDLVEFSILQ